MLVSYKRDNRFKHIILILSLGSLNSVKTFRKNSSIVESVEGAIKNKEFLVLVDVVY